MSFSSEVKHEITTRELDDLAVRAQLSAFFHINATMHIVQNRFELQIQIQNATIAKRIYQLVKHRYDVDVELKVLKQQAFHKGNIYRLRIREKAILILEDLGIYDEGNFREVPYDHIVVQEPFAQGYLAGAFLASGSVNSPNKPDYHLEMSTEKKSLAEFIVDIIHRFGLNARITKRRSKYIIYLKAADQIADFLKIVGAYNMTMQFEDIRIQRDFRNSLTRLDNMELANDVKTITAGNRQIDAILNLMKHNRYSHLDDKLIDAGNLRLDHPESSLNELIDIYYQETGNRISKSGLQHRFNKIIELSNKLSEKES